MVRVFLINFGYYAQEEHATLADALSWARQKGFEVAFHQNGNLIGSWSALYGFRSYP